MMPRSSWFNVDCPDCDAKKDNPRALKAHYRAVARADAEADRIQREIEEAARRKDARR